MANFPVLIFDWKELPNIADNIWHAQMAGWERILTYRGPLPNPESSGIRRKTMTYYVPNRATGSDDRCEVPVIRGHERDEYPFACTVEGSSPDGNRSVWVNPVPAWENNRQGRLIAAFIQAQNITADGRNRRFEVRVVNHPRGPVLPPLNA